MTTSRIRRPDAVALIVLGGLLVALALPVAVREMLLLRHWSTFDRIDRRLPLTIDALREADQALAEVRDFPPSERVNQWAARVARRRFDPVTEAAALQHALYWAPGDAMLWMRLAQVLPPGVPAAHALRLSALTNAFEFEATPTRVDLGLRLWPHMDQGDRDAFGRLVGALWRWETGRLAMVAAQRRGYDQIAAYFPAHSRDWDNFTASYQYYRLHPQQPYLYGPP